MGRPGWPSGPTPSRRRCRLLLVGGSGVVLVVLLVFAQLRTASALEGPVETYLAALGGGRYEEARALLCDSTRSWLTAAYLRAVSEKENVRDVTLGKRGTGADGVPYLSDRGHVYATLETAAGPTDRRFKLRRESGRWRVCPGDPAALLGAPV